MGVKMISKTADGPLYELGSITENDFTALQHNFETLPPDPYAEQRLRSRRYSRFKVNPDGTLERQCRKDFMQTKDINKAVGDVDRHFEEIEDIILNDPAFLSMFKTFKNHTSLHDDAVIEAHQMRWHCMRRVKEPAPEGLHQDGFDFIGVFAVKTYNVDGGEFMIYKSPESAPCFKKALTDGEYAVINDKLLYHNASPLVPTANDEDGYWDVIVLTAHDVN